MLRWIIVLAGLYALWCLALTIFQDKLIFPGVFMRRDGDSHPCPDAATRLWRDVENGQRVEAWFIPGRGRSAASPGPLAVYAHGNAELIDDHPPGLSFYTAAGISLLLPEYRGFGRSGGMPGEAAIVDDFQWFLDEVSKRPEVDPRRLILHGRSIGGGVVAQLAARRKPAALILESTFSSLTALTGRYLVPAALLKHTFRTDQVVPALDTPILILHGTRDSSISIDNARRLLALNNRGKLIEFDADHNDFPPDSEAYARAILGFLSEAAITRD